MKCSAAASCPGAEPAATLRGAALPCGCFLARTGWVKGGRVAWGLSRPTAPLLLGKGGYAGLASVSRSDELGRKRGMKHVVFSPRAAGRKLV